MSIKRYIEIFKDLKKDGINRQEAEDYLEFDSDEYPDPDEIAEALNAVYGKAYEYEKV